MAYPTANFTLYIHINKLNNKKYIGITKQKVDKRWQNGQGYMSCPLFYNAIKKYGWDSFEHKILFVNLTKEEACTLEKELIIFHKSNKREFGYNISNGGECVWLGLHHTEETRKKMSLAKSNMSEETKQKIINKKKGKLVGKDNPMYGKSGKYSPVAKKVICLDDLIIYDCIADIGRKLHLNTSHISAVCKNKLKSTGGYHFMYLEDYKKINNINL